MKRRPNQTASPSPLASRRRAVVFSTRRRNVFSVCSSMTVTVELTGSTGGSSRRERSERGWVKSS